MATTAAAIAANVSLSARVCPEPIPAVHQGRGEDSHRGREATLTTQQPVSPTKNSSKVLAPFGVCLHLAGKSFSWADGSPLSSCVWFCGALRASLIPSENWVSTVAASGISGRLKQQHCTLNLADYRQWVPERDGG